MNKLYKHLSRVTKYLAVWAEPPAERDTIPPLAEAADESPDRTKRPRRPLKERRQDGTGDGVGRDRGLRRNINREPCPSDGPGFGDGGGRGRGRNRK